MKTREQIYGQEAAGILRDVSMYRALTERQLLKLYPHKESKIRNLLSYLQKQGRIVQRGEYYRIPADAEEGIDHGLSKAVWVLTDFRSPCRKSYYGGCLYKACRSGNRHSNGNGVRCHGRAAYAAG